MELLRITRQIHCKAVEQRAKLIHRQYNRDWGTSYSRPPIDPYITRLTSPCYKVLAAPLLWCFVLQTSMCVANRCTKKIDQPLNAVSDLLQFF